MLNIAPKSPVRIAIISQPDGDGSSQSQAPHGLQRIRLKLRDPSRYVVREFLSLDDVKNQLADFKFDILLLRVSYFSATHVQMLAKIHSHFPEGVGLVTSALEIDPMARYQARSIPRHKILQEPSEIQDLVQVIEKLKKGEASPLRQHLRARREGEGELIDNAGGRIKAQFVNFAQMGARMMVRSRQLLQKNTRVQLHYRSSTNPDHVHRIEAVVMWQEVSGGVVDSIMSGPLQTVGLRFIGVL